MIRNRVIPASAVLDRESPGYPQNTDALARREGHHNPTFEPSRPVEGQAVAASPSRAERKCCCKCAFRAGSPERSDPYRWMHMREGWDEDGVPFLCHESVPGHPQEVIDDRPRMRICAGWQACSTTGRFPRATPSPEFAP